jgi:nucleoside-diphosphate kinase
MIKPDAMKAQLAGTVFSRLEGAGLKPVAVKMIKLDDSLLNVHYAHHKEKPFFQGLKDFMKETPVIASVWEGENAITKVREIIGATDPEKAGPGTLRNEHGSSIQRNLVHASDAPETAKAEIKRFFDGEELFQW